MPIPEWRGTWWWDLPCNGNRWMKFSKSKLHPTITVIQKVGWRFQEWFWKVHLSVFAMVYSKMSKKRNSEGSIIKFGHFNFSIMKGDSFSTAYTCRIFPRDSRMTWHLVIGPSMQRQSMDEVWEFETSSTHNSCIQGPINMFDTILEYSLVDLQHASISSTSATASKRSTSVDNYVKWQLLSPLQMILKHMHQNQRKAMRTSTSR